MRTLAATVLGVLVLASCGGGGGGSSHDQPRGSGGASRGFGDLVGMQARFPHSWYAQPYSDETLLVTSFPVHVDDGRAMRAVPPGGTAIEIFDSPGGSMRACRRAGGEHGYLRLGHYEPNYEGFGAAYRIQFHEHGHVVLAFVSFGGRRPTAGQRRDAEAVLNSVHVGRGACPVKSVLRIGAAAARPTSPAFTPLVTLRQLGTFATRCVSRPGSAGFATAYVAGPRFATETVTLTRGRGAVVRRTLDPGERWVTPLGPPQVQRWRISQATEPQTITAAVRITPGRCPFGVPRTVVRFGTAHFNSGP